MAIYSVYLGATPPGQIKANLMLVSAGDATNAKAIAKARYGATSKDAWDNATATLLADDAEGGDDDLVGYVFHIIVKDTAGAVVAQVEFTGDADDDTLDLIGAELVTLLNATASIAGAAYASNVLTVASGSGGDDLGDHTVEAYVYAPAINDNNGDRQNRDDVAIPAFIGTITHEGSATDPLSVAFAADTFVIPTVLAGYQAEAV